MPTIETTVRIGVAPEVVTGVLLDAELAPAWTAGLERLELVAGEPGEAGCIGLAHYVEGTRRYTLEDVLEEVRPARYYRSCVTGGGMTATIETTLEPIADGETRLTLRWAGKGTTVVTRILLPLMRRQIVRRVEADLDSLRQVAESVSR